MEPIQVSIAPPGSPIPKDAKVFLILDDRSDVAPSELALATVAEDLPAGQDYILVLTDETFDSMMVYRVLVPKRRPKRPPMELIQ